MDFPKHKIPIQEISLFKGINLVVKREDFIHSEISGNKYWKLFYNIKNYLSNTPQQPMLITFGGAFSNHIAATAALARDLNMPSIGIIRGEELHDKWSDNPTLKKASIDGMKFQFVTRSEYRDKITLTEYFKNQYPEALIIPEGGTNQLAVEGIKHMLDEQTANFDYLCTAVGTGGTIAGLSKFAEEHQKVLGFQVVNDDIENRIVELSGRRNFALFDALMGGYGKISDDNISFINRIYREYQLPLDPIYTGKMFQQLLILISEGYFEEGSKILAFHTGGLQGIYGANEILKKQGRILINYDKTI